MEKSNAGDIVYFRGGVYHPIATDGDGVSYNTHGSQHSGTSDNWITYEAYPADYAAGNYPILDCSNVDPTNDWNYGILLKWAEYIKFKGLRVRNVYQIRDGVAARGIVAWYGCTMILENCVVYDIDGCGIGFKYDEAPLVNDVEVINCDTYGCADYETDYIADG